MLQHLSLRFSRGYDALAAAHSRAAAQLSRDIADAVRVLERDGDGAPPAEPR